MRSIQESTKRKTELSMNTPVIDVPGKDETCSTDLEEIRNIVLPKIQNELDQGRNDEAIQLLNTYIDDLKNETLLITTIKLQLKAWKNKGNLVEQLKLSETLIRLAPEDPEGYINAAEVYSARGQQNSVMGIAQEGMKKVADMDDVAYKRLARQFDDAEIRISKQIDFLGQFPYDLACIIPEYLPLESLVECSQVSRSWRDQILHNSTVWRTFTIDSLNDSTVLMLRYVTLYVEELNFEPTDGSEMDLTFSKFMQVLELFKFPNLRKLVIRPVSWIDDRYYSALSSLSTTVTDIYLSSDQNQVPLSFLLLNFRNLTSLQYYTRSNSDEQLSVPILPYTTSLRMLYLDIAQNLRRTKATQVENLFKHSPHLRIIILNDIKEKVLPVICKHCPNVTLLSFNDYEEAKYVLDDVTKQMPTDATGLHYLSLSGITNVNHIRKLLETHQSTTRILYIVELNLTNTGPFLTIPLPHIEELKIDISFGRLTEYQVLSLLQNCSSTRDLSLIGLYSLTATNNIFRAIRKLAHLDSLCMYFLKISADEDVAIQSLQNLYHLKKVYIDGASEMVHILINAAAHIPNLEHIYVYAFSGRQSLTNNQLRDFTSKLSMLKHLRTVSFTSMLFENVDILKEFQKSKSLISMTMADMRGISQNQAREALPQHISLSF